MNTIKKLLGVVWIVLGPVSIFYLVKTAAAEISKKPTMDTKIQWGVFVLIFLPIAFGLSLFGYYALKNEFEHLPENSAEVVE